MRHGWPFLLLVLAACPTRDGTETADTDTDTDSDTDTDTDVDNDADDDGYDSVASGGDDCNDLDPSVNPGAKEVWYDGVDSNCDGASDYDRDGDGHDSDRYGGDDCDDLDPKVVDTCPGDSNLDFYAAKGKTAPIEEIVANLSGVTWNPVTQTYLGVTDSRWLHELDADITHLREIELTNANGADTEDIAWLGLSKAGHEYAIVTEQGNLLVGVVPDDGSTSLDLSTWQTIAYAGPPKTGNKGGEGVAWDAASGTFWVCTEKSPMIVYTFARPKGSDDVSWEADLVVTEPFDAEDALYPDVTDVSSCIYDPRTGHLLVLSHESSVVLEVDPANGDIWGALHVDLSYGGADKPEGITFDDAYHLLLVGEPNLYRRYLTSQ